MDGAVDVLAVDRLAKLIEIADKTTDTKQNLIFEKLR